MMYSIVFAPNLNTIAGNFGLLPCFSGLCDRNSTHSWEASGPGGVMANDLSTMSVSYECRSLVLLHVTCSATWLTSAEPKLRHALHTAMTRCYLHTKHYISLIITDKIIVLYHTQVQDPHTHS
jgi:hypothetical protein